MSRVYLEGKSNGSARSSKPKPLTLKAADLGNNRAPNARDLMQKDPQVQERLAVICQEGPKDGKSAQAGISEELTDMLKDPDTLKLWKDRAATAKVVFHERKKEKKAAQSLAAECKGISQSVDMVEHGRAPHTMLYITCLAKCFSSALRIDHWFALFTVRVPFGPYEPVPEQ
ncbi:hypothetical protein EWM64_g1182 [Hericium alpestre]|uniref:Uncharacterized protein n=1 Tax=Hericium alpestre TaxID=135208 RepID=A0A4Z0AA55_9AGAM|nr:hypothetical protein EWM64_g1182 [Hericium alpestre]